MTQPSRSLPFTRVSSVLAACVLSVGMALPGALSAQADPGARVSDLLDALATPELMDIMAREGLAHGEDLRESMFPGAPATGWEATVADIYDAERMQATFSEAFADAVDGTDLWPALDYFTSPVGEQLISLELSAREALLTPGVEETAVEDWQALESEGGPFVDDLRAFVAANDLVEANVVGALNSNYAFYTGLADGGSFAADMSEAEILSDVWSQETEVRAETEEWVFGYLSLAYRPLPEGVLADYTAFSLTEPGQALNTALFSAFDVLFTGISRDLGRAVALQMSGEDL